MAGETDSLDFPTKDPYQEHLAGYNTDAFITKLTSTGSELTYSTYLGGDGSDWAGSIAVDGLGNVIVTGTTQSDNFPTQNPYQPARAGSADVFVTKLSEAAPDELYVSISGDCGGKSPCYTAIQEAMGAAGAEATIFITGETYSEAVVLEESKVLSLKGGWDSSFTTQSSYTGITSMTIKKGTVSVDRLVARQDL